MLLIILACNTSITSIISCFFLAIINISRLLFMTFLTLFNINICEYKNSEFEYYLIFNLYDLKINDFNLNNIYI